MLKKIQVLILAGGMGTRLHKVVNNVPKPMAQVGNKPFLEYLILVAKQQGFTTFKILTGYKSEVITSYFGDGSDFGISIDYSHETHPLGTGGAIKSAIINSCYDRFICMNGDSFFGLDMSSFVERAEQIISKQDLLGSLSLKYLETSSRYGAVTLTQNYQINGFFEKESCEHILINAGVYYFKKEIAEFIDDGFCSLEGDSFPALSKRFLLSGIPSRGNFIDIGIPEDYYAACNSLNEWVIDSLPCSVCSNEDDEVKQFDQFYDSLFRTRGVT